MHPTHSLKLNVPAEEVPFCVGLIAAGLITMIQRRTLDSRTGIWTLGAPRFWDPLTRLSGAAQELVDILQGMDELAAIERMTPDHFDAALAALLSRLDGLVKRNETGWTVSWDVETIEPENSE